MGLHPGRLPGESSCTGWRLGEPTIPTVGQTRLWGRLRLTTNTTVNLDGWFIDDRIIR